MASSNMLRFDADRAFEVGHGAGDFQDAVVSTRGQALLGHGAFQQPLAIRRQLAGCTNMPRPHLRVAVKLFALAACQSLDECSYEPGSVILRV